MGEDLRRRPWRVKNGDDLPIKEYTNKVYCIDSLKLLKNMPSESVDLVYIDPPFFTQKSFKNKDGIGFEDKFESITHYVEWMKVRIVEIHRVLKRVGNLYLHCDKNASHYLKVMVDGVFARNKFRHEIVWQRKTGNASGRSTRLSHYFDIIFCYSKSQRPIFNQQYFAYSQDQLKKFKYNDSDGRGPYCKGNLEAPSYTPTSVYDYKSYSCPRNGWMYKFESMSKLDRDGRLFFPKEKTGRITKKSYLKELKGVPLTNIWTDIDGLKKSSKESLDYPTQKREALLGRIIKLGSNESDIVADFFCGSGTTLAVAKKLGRKYIGCDSNPDAVRITKDRLDGIPE